MVEPSIVFLCAKCGEKHQHDYKQQWGSSRGVGLGPIPVCDKIVENTARGAMEVCKGDLVATTREM